MDKNKSFSSKDVAKEAGVSQATVSYVLNDVKGIKIKSETKEAVLLAAKKLNYHPNIIARSMKLKKSMSIGIVTEKNISSFAFMNVLEGIKDGLVIKNYTITLCLNKFSNFEESDFIKYYRSNRIDGVIFVYASLTDEQVAYLIDNNIPFVIIDTNGKNDRVHLVKTDIISAVCKGIEHIVNKGVSRIAYIGTNAGDICNKRYQGYLRGMEINNIPIDENIICKLSGTEDEINNQIKIWLPYLQDKVDSIITDRTIVAFNLLKYAAEKGIRIPSDISVIAIGTSQFSSYSYPSLSTVEAPLYDLGRAGCSMLFDIMDDEVSKEIVVLEWKFIGRDSS